MHAQTTVPLEPSSMFYAPTATATHARIIANNTNPITLLRSRTLNTCRRYTISSIVPHVTRRYVTTSLLCPMRYAACVRAHAQAVDGLVQRVRRVWAGDGGDSKRGDKILRATPQHTKVLDSPRSTDWASTAGFQDGSRMMTLWTPDIQVGTPLCTAHIAAQLTSLHSSHRCTAHVARRKS